MTLGPAGSHAAIVRALARGAVRGATAEGAPSRHLVTQVSHLFFHDRVVYKLCRVDNEAFNHTVFDFADAAQRSSFLRDDFALNRYFSPSVYLDLVGLAIRGEDVRQVAADDEAAELAIVMRRLEESANLTRELLAGRAEPDEAVRLGAWLAGRVAQYPIETPTRPTSFVGSMGQRLDDVVAFSAMGSPVLQPDVAAEVDAWLRATAIRLEAYFADPPGGIVVGVDSHSDNVFREGADLLLLDAFQIKPIWRRVDPLLNASRLATDVIVLGGADLGRRVLDGFLDRYPGHPLPRAVLDFYGVYAALIRVVLWTDAGRPDLARRYIEFIRATMRVDERRPREIS